MKFGFDRLSCFSGEDVDINENDNNDDNGRLSNGFTISSTCEPGGSGELIKRLFKI